MNKDDLLWLAGLMDAEGSFTTAGKTPVAKIIMTDFDIIEFVKDLTQHKNKLCTIKCSHKMRKDRVTPLKDQFALYWNGKDAETFSTQLAPFLSNRRRSRINELFSTTIDSLWDSLTTEEKFMWVVGYVEGEGSFYLNIKKYPRFQLETTDEDAVRRVGDYFGLTVKYYHSPSKKSSGRKPHWVMRAQKCSIVEAICEELYPYMFSKKRSDIDRILA